MIVIKFLIVLLVAICILYLFSEDVLCGRVVLGDCDGSKRSFIKALEKWDSMKVELEEKYDGRNIITKRVFLTELAQWCVEYEVGAKIKYEDMNFIERD